MAGTLSFHKWRDWPVQPEGWTLVVTGMTHDSVALRLSVEERAREDVHARDIGKGGSFPRARMQTPARMRLDIVRRDGHDTLMLPSVGLAHLNTGLFPDGRILIVGARSRWRAEGDFDLNGAIIDPATGEVHRFLAGDGVQDVAIDARGRIWVSYFDEGVFGNFGWGRPGPKGPGAGGLVCFDDQGRMLWQFNREDQEAFIDDCYALNCDGSGVWAFYSTDFHLCHVDGAFQESFVAVEGASGAHAMAIDGELAVFSAGYHQEPGQFTLLGREGRVLRPLRQLEGVMPGDVPIGAVPLIGRGALMHMVGEEAWFVADVRQR